MRRVFLVRIVQYQHSLHFQAPARRRGGRIRGGAHSRFLSLAANRRGRRGGGGEALVRRLGALLARRWVIFVRCSARVPKTKAASTLVGGGLEKPSSSGGELSSRPERESLRAELSVNSARANTIVGDGGRALVRRILGCVTLRAKPKPVVVHSRRTAGTPSESKESSRRCDRATSRSMSSPPCALNAATVAWLSGSLVRRKMREARGGCRVSVGSQRARASLAERGGRKTAVRRRVRRERTGLTVSRTGSFAPCSSPYPWQGACEGEERLRKMGWLARGARAPVCVRLGTYQPRKLSSKKKGKEENLKNYVPRRSARACCTLSRAGTTATADRSLPSID